MGLFRIGREDDEREWETAAAASPMNFLSKLIPSEIQFCPIKPLGAEVDW
jgi:hypothetical protein